MRNYQSELLQGQMRAQALSGYFGGGSGGGSGGGGAMDVTRSQLDAHVSTMNSLDWQPQRLAMLTNGKSNPDNELLLLTTEENL